MRKISKTLALMSLLAPLGANALGIGDIRLHSALNQSLDAEIPLVTSGGDDISDIRVGLASQEAFDKAGIERHYLLSKLRFKPMQKEDGSYVIQIRSTESISEPFLNFMIEVYWPQGRLQREFTVLLDPPASFQETTAETEAELPETEPYQGVYERPARPADIEPPPERPRRPAIKQARVSEAPAAPAEEAPVTGTQYGPISSNETLWSIAQQNNQDASVSQEKMMRALYKANPHAFYRNNINALKAGETITIPDRETIVRLTGAPLSAAAPRRTGRLTARVEKPSGEMESVGGESGAQGHLKLLAPTPGKSKEETASSGGKGKAGRGKEEAAALEAAEAFKQENEEIRKRLADFEQQLTDMQRLLSLKNEEIAALQAQKQGARQPPQSVAAPLAAAQPQQPPAAPAQTALPPPTVSTELEKPPIAPAEQPAKQSTPAQQQEATAKPSVAKAPEAVAPPQPAPATTQAPPAQAKPARPATPPKATPPPAPPKDQGIMAELREHPSYYLVGGIVGLLAASLWLIKRRRAAMIDDTESILTLSDREKIVQAKRPPIQLDHQSSGISEQSTTTARSSFLSEFTPSDFDALGGEMEEVDPISEADVYLAYGRYKQAEELIRSAIAQNPERDECKLKLLEIHYATENAEAFESFAEELAPTHKDTKPDFWEKVAEMGQELCPDSSLFGGHAGGGAAASSSMRKAGPASHEEKALDGGGDFFQQEGEEFYNYPIPSTADQQRTISGGEAAELDYDFFSSDSQNPELATVAGREQEDSSLQADNIIAFERIHAGHEEAEEAQEKTLDDILAELGVLSESAKKPAPEDIGQGNEISFDLGDKDSEPDEESPRYLDVDEASSQYEEESPDYMALTEMDEQETKLDLAKAYFDMGDEESARLILENVAQHGNEAQKEEAWSLLGRLSRKEVNSR